MKALKFLLLASLLVAGCGHNDGNSQSKAGKNNANAAPKDFETVDGKAGGVCKKSVIEDDKIVRKACPSNNNTNDQSAFSACMTAGQNFSTKHPNVDCSYQDGATTRYIKESNESSSSPLPEGPSKSSNICEQRDSAMASIQSEAVTNPNAVGTKAQDTTPANSLKVKADLVDFKAKFKDANCDGISNDDFEQEIDSYLSAVDL